MQEIMPEHQSPWTQALDDKKMPLLLLVKERTYLNPISAQDLADQLGLRWEKAWVIVQKLLKTSYPIRTVGNVLWYTAHAQKLQVTFAYLEAQIQLFTDEMVGLQSAARELDEPENPLQFNAN